MMIPLTKEACERHAMIPPPPQSTVKPDKKEKRRKGKALIADCCKGQTVCNQRSKQCCWKSGREQCINSGNGFNTALEPTEPLPPAKGRWLANENLQWHNELKSDIAMLISNEDEQLDLLEVFCSPTSTMTQTANNSGLKAERWTKEDFDLSRPPGYMQAAYFWGSWSQNASGCRQSVDRFQSCKMPINGT